MRSRIEEMLGIDPSNPLDKLADFLVSADEQLLNALVAHRKQTISQADVADRMGISQSAVARIESGDRNPHMSTLRRYAHAIRVRVEHQVTPMDQADMSPVTPYDNTFDEPYKPIMEHAK